MTADTSENDAEPALLARWRLIEHTAVAICLTGIGSFSDPGYCVCARDARRPSRDVPHCRACISAATAALQVSAMMATDKLPWRPISELRPGLGDAPVLVCAGRQIHFARWCYGWSPEHQIQTSNPVWTGMEDTIALDPQPLWYLPLSLPE